ncbi:hypothetical protein DFQ30_010960, partial [Apophysomyces sp. BC1015]
MIISTSVFVWRHRTIRTKFEKSILQICGRINATDAVRGIHWRFSKNGSDIHSSQSLAFGLKTVYAIVIEFDDRYNALSNQRLSHCAPEDFVNIPLYPSVAKINEMNEKISVSSYQNFWSNVPVYDEKPN